jgi:hypothetical protein
MLTKTNYFD